MTDTPQVTPEVTPHECNCERLCCPRCQAELLLGRALRKGVKFNAKLSLEEHLAPDGYPYEDYPSEDPLQ